MRGKVFAGGCWEERCHCDGDRSTITDRWDGLSVATACAGGAELMAVKVQEYEEVYCEEL